MLEAMLGLPFKIFHVHISGFSVWGETMKWTSLETVVSFYTQNRYSIDRISLLRCGPKHDERGAISREAGSF